MFSSHGGIPVNRKCDFNNQFKGELTRMFTQEEVLESEGR